MADTKNYEWGSADQKKQAQGDAEIDESTDLLEMLKKIEIKFFELYEKRKKVTYACDAKVDA